MLLALLLSFVPFLQSPDRIVETFPDGKPRFECEARRAGDGSLVRHGKSKSWHANGKLAAEGSFVDGKETGAWTFHFESGKRQSTGSFENGEREGLWKFWRDGGAVELEGKYEAGLRSGEWKRFDEAHKLIETVECRPLRVEDPARHWTWSGSLENDRAGGEWEARRSDGSLALRGQFVDGAPHGEWLHFLADGSFDEGWLSAEFRSGLFQRTLASAHAGTSEPVRAKWSAPALAGDIAALERALADDGATRASFLADATSATGAAAARLATLDLSLPDDAALAGRIHDEVLGVLFGKGPAWPTDPAGQRRVALRWHSVIELLTDEDGESLRGFDPELSWRPMPELRPLLGEPPFCTWFPSHLALPLIRRERTLRTDSGKLAATAIPKAPLDPRRAETVEWLLRHQDPSGAWRPEMAGGDPGATVLVTAECVLALTGEGSSLVRGPHMQALRNAGRWLGTHQSPDGRIGTESRDSLYQHAAATCALIEMCDGDLWNHPTCAATKAIDYLVRQRLADGSWPRSIGGTTGDVATSARALHAIRVGMEPDRRVGVGLLEHDARKVSSAWLSAQGDALATASPTAITFVAPTDYPTLLALVAFQRFRSSDSETLKSFKHLLELLAPYRAAPGSFSAEGLLHQGRVAHQLGGEAWTKWNTGLQAVFESGSLSQLERLPAASRAGGSLLTAAFRAQILQVESRFLTKARIR